MRLFHRLFCKHKWATHTKKEYEWTNVEIIKGTEDDFKPKFQNRKYSKTREVLICANCGKIKQIEY